ncbi:MAG: hypothetical protein JPMHGGIA_00392 [Saprospiraceae bacterium]|jgi:hypothetical protein|nr:hypothetical protein [Saprospiraceae bacterium]
MLSEKQQTMSKTVFLWGYRFGMAAFVANAAFVVVQAMQLLRWIHYPYDEILIYGFSLCIVGPFLLEMLALHYIAEQDKKFWSHGALLFTLIYAVFVTANYVVQLTTVIPMNLRGVGADIKLLAQTPHSMFWDYDAIGYIAMGIACLLALPVFERQGFGRWVRHAFLANALVTPLIAFVYFYPEFSERLLLLGIPWTITAPAAMLFLALYFRRMTPNERT